MSSYRQEPSVYRKKALFLIFFLRKLPCFLQYFLPSEGGEKQVSTMWISRRISFNAAVLQQNESQKMAYFYIRIKPLTWMYSRDLHGPHLLQVSSCNTGCAPTAFFYLLPSQSSWWCSGFLLHIVPSEFDILSFFSPEIICKAQHNFVIFP